MCHPHCVLNKASCSAMMNYERRDNSLAQPTKESKLADAGSVSPSRHNTGKSHKAIEKNQGPLLSNTQTLLISVRSFLVGHLPAEKFQEIGNETGEAICCVPSSWRQITPSIRLHSQQQGRPVRTVVAEARESCSASVAAGSLQPQVANGFTCVSSSDYRR